MRRANTASLIVLPVSGALSLLAPAAPAQTDCIATPTRSGLALTGANVSRWVLIDLGLLATGLLPVIGARRRRGAAGNA